MRQALLVRYSIATLTALAVLHAAGTALAAPNVIRTLPNKMTVIVRENRSRPLASIQVWVDAGSRDESRSERGVSSVLSYLPYEETSKRKRGETLREVESFGGTLGSESGYSRIIYNITVPARYLGRGLDVLSDAVLHPLFNQYTLNQALAKARRTSRGGLSTASGASVDALREALYGDTPPGAPAFVPEPEIAALTLSLAERYYKDHFVAENITVVVVGDVEAATVVDQVAAAFQGLPTGKSRPHPRVNLPKESDEAKVRWVANPADTQGSAVGAGFRAPVWGSADALALDVLMAVLVDVPGSRLERRLHEASGETGAAAVAQRSFGPDPGLVALIISADPSRLSDAEGVLLQEIEKIRSQPVTADECDAAIRAVIARELVPRAELWGIGRATAIAQFQGRPGADEVFVERLRAVRPEDLSAVARKYLDWKSGAFVEMMPSRTADSLGVKRDDLPKRFREKLALYQGTYRSGPLATASTDDARRARIDQAFAAIPATPVDAGRGRVERAKLGGGIKLLTGVDRSSPSVTIAVYMSGGVRYENDKNNGITSLLRESLLNSNDPKRNGLVYRQSLSLLGSIVPYQDRDMWGYSLAVPSSEWKEALNRLGTMLAHPDLDSTTVDATRILLLTALDKWQEDDSAQRQRLIFATKYTVSGYRLPGVGNRLNLISMPTSSVAAFYKKFVVKPNLVVAVFGDVNSSEVGPAVEEAFRDVGAGPFHPGEPPKDLPFPGFREKWELGGGANTTVQLAFNGPPASSPDIPVFYVVNSLLTGPYGWFAKYVMAEPSAQGASSIVAQAIDESPIIATMTITGPMQEEAMVKLLFRQFKKVAGLELVGELEADLRDAKTHAIGSFYAAFNTNTSRAFQWARADLFGLPPEYLLALPSKMEAVTPDDLRWVGKRYFQQGDWEKAPYAIAETRPGGW